MISAEVIVESRLSDQRLRERVIDQFEQLLQRIHAEIAEPWLELELTMPQLKMLLVVDWLGPAPMSQVAARLGVGVSAATGLVERLEEHGLARRAHDARDRRVVLVASTTRGRDLVVRLRSVGCERFATILAMLSGDDLRRFAEGMEILSRAAVAETVVAAAPPVAGVPDMVEASA